MKFIIMSRLSTKRFFRVQQCSCGCQPLLTLCPWQPLGNIRVLKIKKPDYYFNSATYFLSSSSSRPTRPAVDEWGRICINSIEFCRFPTLVGSENFWSGIEKLAVNKPIGGHQPTSENQQETSRQMATTTTTMTPNSRCWPLKCLLAGRLVDWKGATRKQEGQFAVAA